MIPFSSRKRFAYGTLIRFFLVRSKNNLLHQIVVPDTKSRESRFKAWEKQMFLGHGLLNSTFDITLSLRLGSVLSFLFFYCCEDVKVFTVTKRRVQRRLTVEVEVYKPGSACISTLCGISQLGFYDIREQIVY